MPKIYRLISISIFLFFLATFFAYGYNDGFSWAGKMEGKHFIIYYSPQLDPHNLSQQLDIGIQDKILAGNALSKPITDLADMVDTLFLQVCNILDMQLYRFKGNIKICRDSEHLGQVYHNIFDNNLKESRSFYVYNLNTIYISSEVFQRAVLGHEIAHAIISHYFVVQPSVKIQEVLAGYVEYQLRKTGQ